MADTIKYDTELTLEHTRNGRHYCPKEVLAEFLSQPASNRICTLGFPKPFDHFIPDSREDILQKAGVGTIDSIVENGDTAIATLNLDPKLPASKTLIEMLKSGVKFSFGYRGIGECLPDDENVCQFTEITSVAILPEFSKENADEV